MRAFESGGSGGGGGGGGNKESPEWPRDRQQQVSIIITGHSRLRKMSREGQNEERESSRPPANLEQVLASGPQTDLDLASRFAALAGDDHDDRGPRRGREVDNDRQ